MSVWYALHQLHTEFTSHRPPAITCRRQFPFRRNHIRLWRDECVFSFSELIPHTVHSFSTLQNILHYFYCWGKCDSNICQCKWQLQKCAVDPNVLRVIVVSRSFINWYSHAVCQHAGIQKEGIVSECRSRRVVIYTFLLQQFSNFLLSGEVAWSVSFTWWSVKTLATQSVSKEQEWRKKFTVSCSGNAPPLPQEQLYFIVNAM